VLSIFKLGEDEDYLYHVQMTLKGVHTDDTLQLTEYELEGRRAGGCIPRILFLYAT
jgi:hypothetical protein